MQAVRVSMKAFEEHGIAAKLVVEPHETTLNGLPAVYAEWEYIDESGEKFREAGYFYMLASPVHMLSYEAPVDVFNTLRPTFDSLVEGFSRGTHPDGCIALETLESWPTATYALDGLFSVEWSSLWSFSEPDSSALDKRYMDVSGRSTLSLGASTATLTARGFLERVESVWRNQDPSTEVLSQGYRSVGDVLGYFYLFRRSHAGMPYVWYVIAAKRGDHLGFVQLFHPDDTFAERLPLFDQWIETWQWLA